MKFFIISLIFFLLLHREKCKTALSNSDRIVLGEQKMNQWVSSSFKSKNGVKLVKSCAALKLTGMTFSVFLLDFFVCV